MGRPRIASKALERALAAVAAGSTPEEAAEAHDVGSRTIRRRLASPPSPLPAPAGKSARLAKPRRTAPSRKASSRGSQRPAIGKAADVEISDPLALARRILRARNAAALAELEDGLAVFGAGGEAAGAPWLARPLEVVAAARDAVDVMRSALTTIEAQIKLLPPGANAASRAQALSVLGKGIEQMLRGRPQPETEDALVARVARVRSEALALIETTVAAEERAAGLP